MFNDKVVITLVAGKGGNGVVAWTRGKYLPKGGPCGGNGGRGGSIHIKTSKDIFCLDHFSNTKILKAENGSDGEASRRQGKCGKSLTLIVPQGTLVKNAETGELLYDLTEENQEIEICSGGKGGLGNDFFKSPTNRAPRESTPGKPGEKLEVELELKLIADIGFVGLPNAGKSTLLSALTPNKVKIGNYPFTTLKPNLSYIEFDDYSRLFLADIPGIIKDAHIGRGLGLAFLRHIERSKVLIFVIDISGIEGRDPFDDFLLLREEIRLHNPDLLDKPFLVALNKIDVEGADEKVQAFQKKYCFDPTTLFPIAAAEKIGLDLLTQRMKSLSQLLLINS